MTKVSFDLDHAFTRGISYLDIVDTTPTEGDALFDFKRIIKRGGHSTYMLLIKEDEPRFDKHWSALQASGCTYEHGRIKLSIGHRRLFSVDVPPSANLIWIIAILERGQGDDVWMYQKGYRHIP
jgi:hypothetical protein